MDASSRFYFFHRGGCSCDVDKAKMMMISLSIVELLYPKGNPSFKNFPPCLGHCSNIIDLSDIHITNSCAIEVLSCGESAHECT